jgi:hypothetical protein
LELPFEFEHDYGWRSFIWMFQGRKKKKKKLIANFGYYFCHFVNFFEKDICHKFSVFLKTNWQKMRKN